jgi:CDP-diacylglycerol--glycerol-3-phosphate 3-phosphatidyltransferase
VDYFWAFWRKVALATENHRKRDNDFVLSRRKKDMPA